MSGPISEAVEAAIVEGEESVDLIVREATVSLRAFVAGMNAKHKVTELERHLDEVEMDLTKLRKILKEARK